MLEPPDLTTPNAFAYQIGNATECAPLTQISVRGAKWVARAKFSLVKDPVGRR